MLVKNEKFLFISNEIFSVIKILLFVYHLNEISPTLVFQGE